tara:strand:+ start:595 stop:1284 length:690 start_codon:yes stop_codon:yes gene_type:complete
MSDETRLESELVKSLNRLDEILSKAQIQQGKGNEPKNWAGTKPEKLGDKEEEDAITTEENGTDGKVSKSAEESDLNKSEDKSQQDLEKSEKDVNAVEVSQFMTELTKAVAIHCSNLQEWVVKSVQDLHAENGEIVKALAENLSILDTEISKSQENIVKYSEGAARGPKSVTDMSKSVENADVPEFSKEQALGLLMKGVEANRVSPLEVIKCEQYGPQAIDQGLLKSLSA